VRRTDIERLILIVLLILIWSVTSAAEGPRPVFVKAACGGKISSAVLSLFKDEIRTSKKYEEVTTLDDNGKMETVLDLQMSCQEHDNVAAFATVFGVAKCFGPRNCHVSIDGSTLGVLLCYSTAVPECEHAIFRAFDDYMSRPNPAHLKLE